MKKHGLNVAVVASWLPAPQAKSPIIVESIAGGRTGRPSFAIERGSEIELAVLK
jgi:hypothetical protein